MGRNTAVLAGPNPVFRNGAWSVDQVTWTTTNDEPGGTAAGVQTDVFQSILNFDEAAMVVVPPGERAVEDIDQPAATMSLVVERAKAAAATRAANKAAKAEAKTTTTTKTTKTKTKTTKKTTTKTTPLAPLAQPPSKKRKRKEEEEDEDEDEEWTG
jgi:topoisomerase IA-like protein